MRSKNIASTEIEWEDLSLLYGADGCTMRFGGAKLSCGYISGLERVGFAGNNGCDGLDGGAVHLVRARNLAFSARRGRKHIRAGVVFVVPDVAGALPSEEEDIVVRPEGHDVVRGPVGIEHGGGV